jgi:uncharacterized PurR-regulated membrane protein YhhQ (DUF165 family)
VTDDQQDRPGITATGGWCAPPESLMLPDVQVLRGGVDYQWRHDDDDGDEPRWLTARWLIAALSVAAYLGSVVLANWLTTRYGFIDVGWEQAATAGTFAAGGALVVRDVVQDALGRLGVVALIVAGALLSLAVADARIAWASAAAFLCAELLDMAAYTPLRRRGQFGGPWWARGVVLGAAVGAVADTVLFLWIAFGWSSVADGLPGQLIAKAQVVLGLLALGAVVSSEVLRQSLDTRNP